MDNAHAHAHDDGRVHAHVSPVPFLVAIFLALIFLTFVTVGVSYFDFGPANMFVAMLVATMKATLVAVFFMHLRHEKPFIGIIFVMSFVFLGLFLMLTWDDISTRGRVDESSGTRQMQRSGEMAPGGMPQPEPARAAPGAAGAADAGPGAPTSGAAGTAHGGAGAAH